MIDFSKLVSFITSKGVVVKVEVDNEVVWRLLETGYSSFGDSIAAGHTIDDRWEIDYGVDSQYGKNGNTETAIVPGSYTHLIQNDLIKRYGENHTFVKSFGRSGDRVDDLISKLSHDPVRYAIQKSDIVTLCIGANDVLEPALSNLEQYIYTGDLSTIAKTVESNLAVLDTDSHPNSYRSLFDKLAEINPNARFIFTTVYNPYKYLWIDDGPDGFFKPVLDTIPQMTILGFEVDKLIKQSLLNTGIVRQLFDRVNGLNEWAEHYVILLNNVLKSNVKEYQSINPRFMVADSKALFDGVPDRPISAQKHYNDLVNVEYTRGYDTTKMDWGRLWAHTDVGSYWWDLATKYVSLNGIDIEGFATDLITQTVEKVIVPDIDPHPEAFGHYALMRSFVDVLGWAYLDRYTITYNANGGSGTMPSKTITSVDGLTAYTSVDASAFSPEIDRYFKNWNTNADGSGLTYSNDQWIGINSSIILYAQWGYINRYTITYNSNGGSGSMANVQLVGYDGATIYTNVATNTFAGATGYYFTGWNTKPDGSGTSYANGQSIGVNSNITLYAQWSNLYAVTYKHTNHTNGTYGSNETGHQECYALYINGELKPKFGTFASGSSVIYYVPYGSTIRVVVSNYNGGELLYDDCDCDIYLNGANVASGYRGTEYTFTLTGHITVDFRWKIGGSLVSFNAKSWEDCYITM